MEASLKLIKLQLQNIQTRLIWTINQIPNANNTLYEISNLKELRVIISELESMGLFESVTKILLDSAIFTTSNDTIRVQANENSLISIQLNLLKSLIENFYEVLKSTVPEESIDSINIKLPPVNDFDELSKVSREIHVGLTQVIFNEEVNGQTRIISVENGSIWLNVLVGTTAVTVIASLVWSAAVIFKKIQEGKLLEEQVRGLKVKNESLEDILKAQKAETNLMIQAEAEHLNSEHFKVNAPENIQKIKNSITIFAELIGKGAEIHPALVAPENVSNLFPDPTKLIGLESKIKRLTVPSAN
ncbi:hypothetical protein [uncultured Flavobacterium sp.]|jgi:hypothetical protein|uniref:hypothetical protein n=1 Tax=uncultured Flavobacterium sp. TaxID=165435 RepID=UPI0030EB53BA|tara:strand:+ start:74606 stop:75511 length:906 start_codon:yes stop_codon:yes gene_type:complete